MDIEKYEWFTYNVNEDKKSYTIINVDWKTRKMMYIERYINHDDANTLTVGKLFYDENDKLTFKNSGYNNADRTFEEDVAEINTFPLWKDFENEIKEKIKK